MKMPANGTGVATATTVNPCEGGEKKSINQELWQACAGPLANLPQAGTHVIYFPQGHSEQVAASMKKDADYQVPSYPNLPSKLLCLLHNVTLHADPETDEVYAQMTLQPVTSFDKDALLRSDLALKSNKPQTEFFCKTLTASDTSTHGGFSVPRRAAEKIFPPLDFSMQPPAQELVATDLHDNAWTFRHIYRGQPKRHLLTTGWSLFVNGKRLFAGDSVLFIRDEKHQLLLGIRRANRQPTNLSSSVLSSDSMHIGILAAAAHAAANKSPFTVFYNPRASPSEFVIPLAKYYKAVYGNQLSLGMRFRMMFETEDSGTRRYMGTITGINDLDPVRWKNSQWRNLQVGWDESTTGERRNRVSIWEIEPVTSPFFICPPPFFQSKRPRLPGMLDDEPSDFNNLFKRTMPWLGEDACMKDPQALPGLSLVEWMNMQQNSSLANSVQQPNYMHSLPGSVMQNLTAQIPQPNNLQFNAQRLPQQPPQLDQLPKLQKQLGDISQQSAQNMGNQNLLPTSQVQAQILQPQALVQTNNIVHQQPSFQSHQLQRNLPQKLQQQTQHQTLMQSQMPDLANQQLHMFDNQNQLQLLQKLHQQQQHQSVLAQQQPAQLIQLQDQQKQLLDASQGFSRSIVHSQTLDIPQSTPTLPPQSNVVPQQMAKNVRFPNASQLPKIQQQQLGTLSEVPGHIGFPQTSGTNQVLPAGNNILTGDLPSCSTAPSSNNCPRAVQPMVGHRSHQSAATGEGMAQSASTFCSPNTLETISSNVSLGKGLHKSDVKPSVNISKSQNQGFFTHQNYLDTSSSTTSVHIPQNDVHLQPNNNHLPYHPTIPFRETSQDGEVQVDHPIPRGNNAYGTNVHDQLGSSLNPESLLANNLSCGAMLTNYENYKEAQQDLSSSFGVPDMTFSGIDPTINDGSFMNKWAPQQPQFQRMRTYTKVYKRGAVGRSIDISSYSGYDELKQDLARRFGIEGQLEGRQRSGWKLVYVDHENDVLLVGDDPWEEFVNCVRCIKILSQDQQTSLDGDFGNGVLPNQACSSSDGGNG